MDAVIYGAAVRLIPRGADVIAATLLAALTFGAAGAAGGAWLGWRAANPVPTHTQVRAVASEMAPGLRSVEGGQRSAIFVHEWQEWSGELDWLTGEKGYEPGGVWVWLEAPDPAAAVREGGANLTRMGWQVESAGKEVRAVKDGYAITLRTPHSTTLEVSMGWDEPAAVLPLSVAGGIVGFLLGWLVVLRRQTANLGEPFPKRVKHFGLAGLGFLLPSTIGTLAGQPAALWEHYVTFGFRPLAVIGGVLLAVAALAKR